MEIVYRGDDPRTIHQYWTHVKMIDFHEWKRRACSPEPNQVIRRRPPDSVQSAVKGLIPGAVGKTTWKPHPRVTVERSTQTESPRREKFRGPETGRDAVEGVGGRRKEPQLETEGRTLGLSEVQPLEGSESGDPRQARCDAPWIPVYLFSKLPSFPIKLRA